MPTSMESLCYPDCDTASAPSRNRTYNLLIKSQLLCQLSYGGVSRRQNEYFCGGRITVADDRPKIIFADRDFHFRRDRIPPEQVRGW